VKKGVYGAVASSTFLRLFIPTSISTLRVPRSSPRAQPQVESKTRRLSSGLSSPVTCAASARSLRRAASASASVRVVVGVVGVVMVQYLFEALVGGGENVMVVVVIVVEMSHLPFCFLGLSARDGELLWARAVNTTGENSRRK